VPKKDVKKWMAHGVLSGRDPNRQRREPDHSRRGEILFLAVGGGGSGDIPLQKKGNGPQWVSLVSGYKEKLVKKEKILTGGKNRETKKFCPGGQKGKRKMTPSDAGPQKRSFLLLQKERKRRGRSTREGGILTSQRRCKKQKTNLIKKSENRFLFLPTEKRPRGEKLRDFRPKGPSI